MVSENYNDVRQESYVCMLIVLQTVVGREALQRLLF